MSGLSAAHSVSPAPPGTRPRPAGALWGRGCPARGLGLGRPLKGQESLQTGPSYLGSRRGHRTATVAQGSHQGLPGGGDSGTRPGIITAQRGKSRAESGSCGFDVSAGRGGVGRPTTEFGLGSCKWQAVCQAFQQKEDLWTRSRSGL